MKKTNVLNCTTVVLTASLSLSANAKTLAAIPNEDTFYRSTVSLTIPRSTIDLDPNNNSIDEKLSLVLKSYGVTVDKESKIEIHEENSFIDLSCFNCLVRVSNGENPFNGDGGGRER